MSPVRRPAASLAAAALFAALAAGCGGPEDGPTAPAGETPVDGFTAEQQEEVMMDSSAFGKYDN